MAEVIKHSIIQPSTPLGGSSLITMLEEASDFETMDAAELARMLRLNVAIKHSVVQEDERESRLRMILNFGHTAGHAIEADGYRYRHGEAVALGMQVATWIAVARGEADVPVVRRLRSLLEKAKLPVHFEADADAIVRRMSFDKKNVNGRLNWILPVEEGGVAIRNDVDAQHIASALNQVMAESVQL